MGIGSKLLTGKLSSPKELERSLAVSLTVIEYTGVCPALWINL